MVGPVGFEVLVYVGPRKPQSPEFMSIGPERVRCVPVEDRTRYGRDTLRFLKGEGLSPKTEFVSIYECIRLNLGTVFIK